METFAQGSALLQYLVTGGFVDEPARQRAATAWKASGQSVDTVLLELGLIEEDRLADALAAYLGLERTGLREPTIESFANADIPLDFLRRSGIAPLISSEDTITLAVSKPLDQTAVKSIGYFTGLRPIAKIATASEIARHLELLSQTEVSTEQVPIGFGHSGETSLDDADRLRDIASEAPIIRLLNRLLNAAINQGASDIHIEPLEDQVWVRFRIDGVLLVAERLDSKVSLGLVSRIKILAQLNIAEQRLPQDGRIKLAIKGRDIDFRVSTSPTLHGESVVLRILDRKTIPLDFEALGFAAAAIQKLKRAIAHPNGIVLVTGPTGSGKSTTLYAALALLNQPTVKVFTVEDPIEYHLKGVNQVLVRPQIGLDFASVLRSILRQDPDIIMVGEIRDAETARIAVQAALTGHLVLSTVHTNSAAAAVTRLRNLGIEDFLLASTIRAIIAQRLVRKLCSSCGGKIKAPRCDECHGSGHQGRTVIYEILEVTDAVMEHILKGGADNVIEIAAREEGMTGLLASGLEKIALGETSTEEVQRVVGGIDA
jgi:general secretion pathway protein E